MMSESKTVFSEKEKEELIREMTPFIKYTAYRYQWRVPPQLTVDDLISVGIMGLLDAINKYDPAKKTKLKTYAEFRIKGAMLDELRSNDWVSKTLRKKFNDIKAAYGEIERKKDRPATEEEAAEMLGIAVDELRDVLTKVNNSMMISIEELEAMRSSSKGGAYDIHEYLLDPDAPTPLEKAEENDLRRYLGSLIDRLPENEKLVLSLYYYEELTFKEIGAILGRTESRICQVHSQALLRLKSKLSTEHFNCER